MHESAAYKNILKTLYTINERERTRPTCILSPQLSRLISENSDIQNDKNHEIFIELFKYVHKDAKIYQHMKGKRAKNPFDKNKKKLK